MPINEINKVLFTIKYVPEKNRDKEFWEIAENTLIKMYRDGGSIFFRGLMSVIISKWQDESD